MAALIDAEYETADRRLSELLVRHPMDVLALQVAHAFDYLLGNTMQLRDRVARLVPLWSKDMPGYSALAAMHAFGLAETGEFAGAIAWCMHTLERDPGNPRAHHALVHVYEMTQQFAAGSRWLTDHKQQWAGAGAVATHCWWHLALFHLRGAHSKAALGVYDQHMMRRSATLSQLIDASSLLWRLNLEDRELGGRWTELADQWEPRIADGFFAFNDMHAMMAFAGAARWSEASALVRSQMVRARENDMNGVMTRMVGLPACRGILAFGFGHYAQAADLLARLPRIAHRLGGSNAQHRIIAVTQKAARLRATNESARFRRAA